MARQGTRDRHRLTLLGGGKGSRTPDLLIANETLYQLSYTPQKEIRKIPAGASPIKEIPDQRRKPPQSPAEFIPIYTFSLLLH